MNTQRRASSPNPLGSLLRAIRTERQLSIPGLAAKLGVDRNTLGHYERGERLPDQEFLLTFSKVTGHDFGKLVRARHESSPLAEEFRLAERRVKAATDQVAMYAIRRAGLSPQDVAELQERAFRGVLDLDIASEDADLIGVLSKEERALIKAWRAQVPEKRHALFALLTGVFQKTFRDAPPGPDLMSRPRRLKHVTPVTKDAGIRPSGAKNLTRKEERPSSASAPGGQRSRKQGGVS